MLFGAIKFGASSTNSPEHVELVMSAIIGLGLIVRDVTGSHVPAVITHLIS